MNIGVLNRVVGCGLLGLLALACSGSDDPPDCGTAAAPKPIVIKDVSPAFGASVPNSGIVQSFTIVGQHLQLDLGFSLPPAHTAGQSVPAPMHWSITTSGADTVYTSEPFSWQAAPPAHVEVYPSSAFQTADGCILGLPKPLFQYDITAP
jgi:hypothetical protein